MRESQEEEPQPSIDTPSATFDDIATEEDLGDSTREKMIVEEEMMEEIPLPGSSKDEKARKTSWLRLPRAARAAIRRMHMQFGHVKKGPFMEILKAAKCPAEYLEAAKHFRCKGCEYTERIPFQHNKVSMLRPCEFNHTIGIDVNFLHDYGGGVHLYYNIVCMGT